MKTRAFFDSLFSSVSINAITTDTNIDDVTKFFSFDIVFIQSDVKVVPKNKFQNFLNIAELEAITFIKFNKMFCRKFIKQKALQEFS